MATAARGSSAILLGLLVACGATPSAGAGPPTAEVAASTSPAGPPEGWSWVRGDGGGLWVALPPWLEAFDTEGAVFANEPSPTQGLQLMAVGPGGPEPQPARDEVETWLRERIRSPIEALADAQREDLPSGSALSIERLDGAGTRDAWRIQAWAIVTPEGVGYLQVDGPPGAWAGREEDVARIANLLRFEAPPASQEDQPGGSAP